MAAISNVQSFVPDFTVQIVKESAPSDPLLDAVFKTLECGTRAGRMGGIVPISPAKLGSKLKPLSAELSEQLTEFTRSEQGARCQKLLGHLDIQKSETYPISKDLEIGPSRIVVQEQVQTVLALQVLFQGLEGGAKAGRMKGIVPLSSSNLASKLNPLNHELCQQIDEFVRSEQGARCQRLLGYSEIQKAETYPISENLEKAPTPITETDLALIKALVIRHEAKAAARAAETKANEIWVQQQFRKSQAQAISQPIVTKAPKESNVRQLEARSPKEKLLRHAIMCVANVCLLISCAAEILHLVNRQSEQHTAMQKLAAGDLPAAKICYEKIIQSQPQNWEAYLGHAAAIPNDYAKQVSDYNHVLALKPGESHATFGLAKSYYELGDYKSAIGFANRAYAQSPKSEPLEIKAKSLMRLQKFDDASKVFKQILATPAKHSAEQYYMLASCQKELGNHKQQTEYLRKALAVAPKNIGYLNELATVLAADNKFNDAKSTLQRAIAMNSNDPKLHVQLAKVFTQMKAPDNAIHELSQAIDRGIASKADILQQRASLYYSVNNFSYAMADVDDAIAIKPADKSLLQMRQRIVNQLAITKAGLDRQLARSNRDSSSKQVAEILAPTTKLSTDSPVTASSTSSDSQSQQMVLKAYKHIKSGDFKSAIPLLKTAVKIDPENSQAHRYLAFSYLHTGMVTQALSHSKQVVDLGTEQPHDFFSLAEAHFYDGKPQEAIKFYRDALRLNPLYAEARMGAVRSLIALGKVQEAKSVCQDAAYNSRSEKTKSQFMKMLNDINTKNQIASSHSFGS